MLSNLIAYKNNKKENSKIIYRGDWAREERSIMEANGYKNGDDLSGKMFPTLYEINSN